MSGSENLTEKPKWPKKWSEQSELKYVVSDLIYFIFSKVWNCRFFSLIWSLANFLINDFPTECELCKESIYQKRAATLLYARFPYVGSRLSSPWWIMIDIFDLALWPTFQASTIKFCVFGVFILLRHTIHSGLKNNQKVSNQLFVYILN